MTNDSPFTDEQRVWLERRMRAIANEESSGGAGLDVSGLLEDETDDEPDDCPDCEGPRFRTLGNKEPVCPACD